MKMESGTKVPAHYAVGVLLESVSITEVDMPYVNKPRPYKHEYQMQKKRDEHASRMERQRARRSMDKTHYDDPRDKDKTAEIREKKDIDHIKPLSKGGTNSKGNLRLRSPSNNRSFDRNSNLSVKVNKPLKKS